MSTEPSLLEDAGDRYPPEHRVDLPRIERAVREILVAVGENPDREGLLDTPARVARAYEFLFAGLGVDPIQQLTVGFQEDHHEMVLIRDIPFYSTCEHHLLPMIGKAHVGYIPDGKVVGLSKLARLVEGYSRRPQLQERLTAQVADALHDSLGARGAIVVVEADHLCMTIRGVQKPGSVTVTSAVRGHLRQGPTHPPGGHEPYNRPSLASLIEVTRNIRLPDLRGCCTTSRTYTIVKLFRRSRDHGECKHALDPLSGGSQVGTWRILAPKPNRCERVEHHVVDFVLVPGLAFDARGGHFGCAGGFYDKLLVNGLSLRSWLVAGAFESQMLEKVPTDEHDV